MFLRTRDWDLLATAHGEIITQRGTMLLVNDSHAISVDEALNTVAYMP